jgi:hypothetical protein
LTGMTSTSHVTLQATNSIAAGLSGVYVSAKGSGNLTITHPVTPGGTFDIIATPY